MAHTNDEKLPPGFDVAKYAETESFTLTDWAKNVYHRVWQLRLRDMLMTSEQRAKDTPEDTERLRLMLLGEAARVFDAPLTPPGGEIDADGEEPAHAAIVRDMDIVDYMLIRHSTGQSADDELSSMGAYDETFRRWVDMKSSDQDEQLLRQPYWRVEGQLPDGRNLNAQHGNVHLSVNLHASEERQVAEFVQWLRTTKAALCVPEKRNMFTAADQRKWHRNRVLAYFDVKYWCAAAGVEIDDYRMGLTLFPEDIESANPADKIRKSVRPAANEVFTHTFAQALMDQARLEAKANVGN